MTSKYIVSNVREALERPTKPRRVRDGVAALLLGFAIVAAIFLAGASPARGASLRPAIVWHSRCAIHVPAGLTPAAAVALRHSPCPRP